MGCGQSKTPIEIEISISDSSSDFEPLEPLKLYEPKKITEKKEIAYDKQMIRAIFMKEYLRKKAGVIV